MDGSYLTVASIASEFRQYTSSSSVIVKFLEVIHVFRESVQLNFDPNTKYQIPT